MASGVSFQVFTLQHDGADSAAYGGDDPCWESIHVEAVPGDRQRDCRWMDSAHFDMRQIPPPMWAGSYCELGESDGGAGDCKPCR